MLRIRNDEPTVSEYSPCFFDRRGILALSLKIGWESPSLDSAARR